MKMTTESLETQASIMLKNAADRLWTEYRDIGDCDAVAILDRLSTEVYFSHAWTFGEPLY